MAKPILKMLLVSWTFHIILKGAHNLGGMAEAADFFLRTQTLTASYFDALWPTDPKFLAIKDLNPFQTVSKVQEASIILMVGFALSKWPHFNSIHLVRVPFLTGIAVYDVLIFFRYFLLT